MSSKWILTLAALTSTLALGQQAAPPAEPQAGATAVQADRAQLRLRLQQATLAQVEQPRTPPALPDRASDRARFAHENVAFGKKGLQMREAVREAGQRGKRDAEHAGRPMERRHRGMDNGDAMRGNRDHAHAKDHARNQESRGHGMGGMPGPGGGMGGGGMGMGGTPSPEPGSGR